MSSVVQQYARSDSTLDRYIAQQSHQEITQRKTQKFRSQQQTVDAFKDRMQNEGAVRSGAEPWHQSDVVQKYARSAERSEPQQDRVAGSTASSQATESASVTQEYGRPAGDRQMTNQQTQQQTQQREASQGHGAAMGD